MNEIKAPHAFKHEARPWIFLAGSIEMGTAEDWQSALVRSLDGNSGTILNPRRDDWDSTWVQSIDNSQFRQQVEWELEAQELADFIAFYFSPGTKSPITLLELGLFAHKAEEVSDIVVCCPEGFWRKGNVDIVCKRYGILQAKGLGELKSAILNSITEVGGEERPEEQGD